MTIYGGNIMWYLYGYSIWIKVLLMTLNNTYVSTNGLRTKLDAYF